MTLPHQPFVISLSKLREINTKQVIGQVLNGCIEKWDLQPSNQRKKINQKALGLIRVLFFTFFGGRGGIRTHEAFRPEDFKSSAYTGSATRPYLLGLRVTNYANRFKIFCYHTISCHVLICMLKYFPFEFRGSSSVVERLLAKEKVAGSIPVCRSRFLFFENGFKNNFHKLFFYLLAVPKKLPHNKVV
ncbi:MAG: hypothetical protein UU48_C0009G0035 [Candidatus Uhrbacteria bacterium GW2011_GWF2_41_16]|uniref:Uncharacterized protein n=2 Tax=Candidatus Uhriibacteriota TaxID=1752732 RepID=A0A0G0V9S4_9BACT|nr:MAG: hypothetical protein UU35_C0011G0033 [Candidatus Uhrbacteria bacterium GW2011_GWC2_41_11]KKR97763.1 MAG: hypothetical protein UU48_C0009G0035 [Candidatus Uhrbacteria bacterium GW2011_GWF2_41_16]